MRHLKRPNYVKEFVNKANFYLEKKKVKEHDNTLVSFMDDYLRGRKMHYGYQYYERINGILSPKEIDMFSPVTPESDCFLQFNTEKP